MALDIVPFVGFRFRVSIEGIAEGDNAIGFSSVSGIGEETDVIEYRHGQDGDTNRKFRGLTSLGDVTLERAKDDQGRLRTWKEQVFSARFHPASQGTEFDATVSRTVVPYKKTVTIELLNAPGGVAIHRWTLINAWPISLDLGDLDASASELLVETLVLAHEGVVEEEA